MTQNRPWTPGPWKLSAHSTHIIITADNWGVCKFESKHGLYKNWQANARLIAAAPELAEALIRVEKTFPRNTAETLSESSLETSVRAALRKAGIEV